MDHTSSLRLQNCLLPLCVRTFAPFGVWYIVFDISKQEDGLHFRPPARAHHQVLLERYTEPPVCAFHLLAPEWNICQRKYQELQKILKMVRVDTYTVPVTR